MAYGWAGAPPPGPHAGPHGVRRQAPDPDGAWQTVRRVWGGVTCKQSWPRTSEQKELRSPALKVRPLNSGIVLAALRRGGRAGAGVLLLVKVGRALRQVLRSPGAEVCLNSAHRVQREMR